MKVYIKITKEILVPTINVGIEITDEQGKERHLKSKAELKRMLAQGQDDAVFLYSTAPLAPESGKYTGPLIDAPVGRYSFVGPDPYTKRNFYGTINKKNADTYTVS